MEGSRKSVKKIATVLCQGGYRAKRQVPMDEVEGDCTQSGDFMPDAPDCDWGCIGCGSCVTACRVNAVSLNYGVAEVDREICVGCGLCVKACPRNLIQLTASENTIMPRCMNHDPGSAARKICEVSCIVCGICVKNCPAGAVSLVDNCAVIDQELCIACGMCAVKCPRHVIVDADGIFTDNIHKGN